MFTRPSEERHPFNSLLLLIALAFAGCICAIFIAQIVSYFLYGSDILSAMQDGTADVKVQRLFLAFYSIGSFVIPPLLFARLSLQGTISFLHLNLPKPSTLLLLTLVIMFCATPFLEWSVFINQQMKLPSVLESLETWMKYKEMEAEVLTKNLLVMHGAGDLIISLIVIAVLPAVGEELLFRGCIQKILTDWFQSIHVGIWLAAIIFSAIHLQFYGFLPRMLLGALFGYLYYFSKSIWVPVLAHFYNNATAVVSAFLLQQQGKSLDNFTTPQIQKWYLVILSVIFTAFLIGMFIKFAAGKQKRYA